jgi:hypothetical protein
MRRDFEMLNTPKAVLVVLALVVVIDGSIYFLSRTVGLLLVDGENRAHRFHDYRRRGRDEPSRHH